MSYLEPQAFIKFRRAEVVGYIKRKYIDLLNHIRIIFGFVGSRNNFECVSIMVMANKSNIAKADHNQILIFLCIAIAVLVVVVSITLYFVARHKQTTYFTSNEVKVLEFDSSTGPVSPEYQQSQTLILTPTTCTYSVTKIQPASTNTTNCPMSSNIWNAVVEAYNSDHVQSILSAAPAGPTVLGGPEKTITAVYANGDTYKAFVDSTVKDKLNNFVQQVQANIAELRSLGL